MYSESEIPNFKEKELYSKPFPKDIPFNKKNDEELELYNNITDDLCERLKITDLQSAINRSSGPNKVNDIININDLLMQQVQKATEFYIQRNLLGQFLNAVRHKNINPCALSETTVIKIWNIKLQSHIKSTSNSEKKPSPISEEAQQAKEKAQKLVTEKIEKILDKQHLCYLKESILDNITYPFPSEVSEFICPKMVAELQDIKKAGKNPAPILVCYPLREAIRVLLNPAVKASLEKIENEGGNVQKVWEEAVNILGWLILLSADYEWVWQKQKEATGNRLQNIKLEIPVETDSGLDIIFSTITNTPSLLDVENPGEPTYPKKAQKHCIPDVGWEKTDHVFGIKQLIWKIVYKKDPPKTPDLFDNVLLNETLAFRNDNGELYYLATDLQSSLNNEEIYVLLKKDLPDLYIVFMTLGEQNLFVMPEKHLIAWLIEFFRNKPE